MINLKKSIKVVGAIIINEHEEILCALRSENMSLPNYWEFPGGKVEPNELVEEAIIREIKEELNCVINPLQIFNDTTYEYENVIVNLITICAEIIDGTPTATEHDELRWVSKANLNELNWAPADIPAVKQLMN